MRNRWPVSDLLAMRFNCCLSVCTANTNRQISRQVIATIPLIFSRTCLVFIFYSFDWFVYLGQRLRLDFNLLLGAGRSRLYQFPIAGS